MEKESKSKGLVSRRKFLGSAVAAAATFTVMPLDLLSSETRQARSSKPDSNFGGVQIGSSTYSWRSMKPFSPEDVIRYCLGTGISSIELQGFVAEIYAGLPQAPITQERIANMSGQERRDEYDKSAKLLADEQRKWRLSVPMKKFEDLRKMFSDAGISIHLWKASPENWSDEEIIYSFNAAKALGAKGVGAEIGEVSAKRMGPIAEKLGMYAIFHQHAQPKDPSWKFEKFLDYSPANMLNFDIGHYYGCTGIHPNGILEKLHKRIATIHIKDKTGPKSNPAETNMPFGKGETPIADSLLLIKKEKWPIYADIEFEYKIPAGSDAVKEVKKCVEYCKAILT
jgi:sugar phosphate isomerase/epimerase